MRPLAPPHLDRIRPYDPGKPIDEVRRELNLEGEIVKLASNENPLGPSPKGLEAARRALEEIHRYPDGGAFHLRHALAERFDVDPMRVVLGNGSNELLEIIIRAFVGSDETAVISATSFLVYKLVLMGTGRTFEEIPLRPDHAFDLEGMAAAVQADPRVKMVFITSPNNPTGRYVGQAELDRFLQAIPDHVVVVMDEAYAEYVTAEDYPDSLALQVHRPRTITLRTFSKAYGLAGLRVGYGIVAKEVADVIHRLRQPFNCNSVAQAAALAALEDHEHIERSRRLNRVGLDRLTAGFEALGLDPVPSQGNFLLVGLGRPGRPVFDALLRRGVIVRVMDGYGLPEHLRVTVGTGPENERCLWAFGNVLEQGA